MMQEELAGVDLFAPENDDLVAKLAKKLDQHREPLRTVVNRFRFQYSPLIRLDKAA